MCIHILSHIYVTLNKYNLREEIQYVNCQLNMMKQDTNDNTETIQHQSTLTIYMILLLLRLLDFLDILESLNNRVAVSCQLVDLFLQRDGLPS